jgi:hypothetical protein
MTGLRPWLNSESGFERLMMLNLYDIMPWKKRPPRATSLGCVFETLKRRRKDKRHKTKHQGKTRRDETRDETSADKAELRKDQVKRDKTRDEIR